MLEWILNKDICSGMPYIATKVDFSAQKSGHFTGRKVGGRLFRSDQTKLPDFFNGGYPVFDIKLLVSTIKVFFYCIDRNK